MNPSDVVRILQSALEDLEQIKSRSPHTSVAQFYIHTAISDVKLAIRCLTQPKEK